MSDITVKFIDKEYSIPTDVITYVGLGDFTNGIKDALMTSFKRQIWPNVDVIESDNFMVTDFNDQASKFVRKLLDNDIYNRTANDYLQNNKGYELFFTTKRKVIAQIISIRKAKLESYKAGVEGAIYRKEAAVTGLDFGIISGSFVNHMIYAYMDASKQTEQEKAAIKAYNQEIAELDKQNAEYDKQEATYISENVIPTMNAVFTFFAYELLDKFVADLIAVGKFNGAALEFLNLERSNDLLKNLALSNNKQAVLQSAFSACPFNLDVYMQAMRYDLLDYTSFQTAKVFKQEDKILTSLRNELRDPNDHNKLYFKLSTVKLLALYTDSTIKDVTRHIADFIYKAYVDTFGLLTNGNARRTFFAKASENDILAGDSISKEKTNLVVDSIASQNLWNNIVNVCGHADLETRIASLMPPSVNARERSDIDKYLKEQLYIAFESTRKELSEQIKAKRARAEEVRQKAEKEKQKKTIKITAIIASVVLSIILIASLPTIIENSKSNKKEAYIESQMQEVVDTLERKIENQIDDDITITFSYNEFMGYENSLEWSFNIRMAKFDEFVKSGGKDEQLLLEIMDNCRIIENIVEAENDTFDFSFRYDDANIDVSNYDGTVNYTNSFSSETFYYEEYGASRYLHSRNTEYVLDK